MTEFSGNSSHTDHFKLLKEDGTSVLVGARNIIYNLSLPDLQEYTEQVNWKKYFFQKQMLKNLPFYNDNNRPVIVVLVVIILIQQHKSVISLVALKLMNLLIVVKVFLHLAARQTPTYLLFSILPLTVTLSSNTINTWHFRDQATRPCSFEKNIICNNLENCSKRTLQKWECDTFDLANSHFMELIALQWL